MHPSGIIVTIGQVCSRVCVTQLTIPPSYTDARGRGGYQARGRGSVVEQSWRLLRLDPVLPSTRAELTALRDYMADSAEATLTSLAEWVTSNPRQ